MAVLVAVCCKGCCLRKRIPSIDPLSAALLASDIQQAAVKAAARGDVEAMKRLLHAGAQINSADNDGEAA